MSIFGKDFVDDIKKNVQDKQDAISLAQKNEAEEYAFLNTVFNRFLLYVADFPTVVKELGKSPKSFKSRKARTNHFYGPIFSHYISLDGKLFERISGSDQRYKRDNDKMYSFSQVNALRKYEYQFMHSDPRFNIEESNNRYLLINGIKGLCYSYHYADGCIVWGERLSNEKTDENIKEAFAHLLTHIL